MLKRCTGCGRLDNEPLKLNQNGEPYLACCPDSNYKEITSQGSPHADSKFITNIERSGDGTIIEFLLGTRSYDGVWFGEEHPRLDGRFWWRPILKSYIESIEPEFGGQGSPDTTTSPDAQNK